MAAQMLTGKGFGKVYNMAGGIKAWNAETAVGTQELGVELFGRSETPEDVLKVAYSLEQGLREFYLSMEAKASNLKVKQLFAKLSDIEVKHQMSIYLAYCDIVSDEINKEEFESEVTQRAMEGGMSTQEYMDMFQPDMDSPSEIISLAMSIEAQALDLYQRVCQKVSNDASKKILQKIANEEKAHLKSLGELLDSL